MKEVPPQNEDETGQYGPWMLVNRPRRPRRMAANIIYNPELQKKSAGIQDPKNKPEKSRKCPWPLQRLFESKFSGFSYQQCW